MPSPLWVARQVTPLPMYPGSSSATRDGWPRLPPAGTVSTTPFRLSMNTPPSSPVARSTICRSLTRIGPAFSALPPVSWSTNRTAWPTATARSPAYGPCPRATRYTGTSPRTYDQWARQPCPDRAAHRSAASWSWPASQACRAAARAAGSDVPTMTDPARCQASASPVQSPSAAWTCAKPAVTAIGSAWIRNSGSARNWSATPAFTACRRSSPSRPGAAFAASILSARRRPATTSCTSAAWSKGGESAATCSATWSGQSRIRPAWSGDSPYSSVGRTSPAGVVPRRAFHSSPLTGRPPAASERTAGRRSSSRALHQAAASTDARAADGAAGSSTTPAGVRAASRARPGLGWT